MPRAGRSLLPILLAILPSLALAVSLPAVQEQFLPPSETIRSLTERSLATPEPPGRIDYEVVYARSLLRAHRLDVYWPLVGPLATDSGAATAPVIVFYHGGSWLRGDKVTIRIVHRFLDRMRREGWFVVAVNYTTSALRGLGGPVANAHRSLTWLSREAADYGFDLDRVGLYGVSAGGHVALMAGSGAGTRRARRALNRAGASPPAAWPLPFQPAFIFAECAPTDLVAMRDGDAFENSRTFGIFPQHRLLELSPIRWVAEHLPPVLLFHGTADETVHIDQSIDYADALRAAGGRATLEIWPGGNHAFLNLPDEVWYEQETVGLAWFRERFAAAPRASARSAEAGGALPPRVLRRATVHVRGNP